MRTKDYSKLWLVFANIKAKKGHKFNDLVDTEGKVHKKFKGAWANLLVKAVTINEAIAIVPSGLAELNFEIIMIDKIENVKSLIENKELKRPIVKEADWLLNSKFVFMISDRLFPYL